MVASSWWHAARRASTCLTGLPPECTPSCGFGCYLAGLESLVFAALLTYVTWRLETRVRPHIGCCPSFLRSQLAPLTPRQLLDVFWRHCRYAALGKALTWFAVFPIAMLIEPTYRRIYAEAGWYDLMFDARRDQLGPMDDRADALRRRASSARFLGRNAAVSPKPVIGTYSMSML